MMSLYGTAIFQSAKFQLSLVCLRVFVGSSCLVVVISTLHRQKQQKRKIDQIKDTKTISVWNAADRSGSANLWLRQRRFWFLPIKIAFTLDAKWSIIQ
jgi:hypothetical protein